MTSESGGKIVIKRTKTGIRIFLGESMEFRNRLIRAIKQNFAWIGRSSEPFVGQAGNVFHADLDIPKGEERAVLDFLADFCKRNNITMNEEAL